MPGVTVQTQTRSGPISPAIPAAGRYFVAGITERGRTDAPGRVRSVGELEALYGTRQAYGAVYDDVVTYFQEGGMEAYVQRVVGASATVGTLSLMDGAATALATLRLDALGAGSWATRVSADVIAGTATGLYTIRVYFDGVLRETYTDLDTPAAGANALLASGYVRGTDLGSASVAPTNNPKPATSTALSTGNDQRATVTATDVTTALAKFGPNLGTGAVSTPGYDSSLVGAALIAHARSYRRVALLATTMTATSAAAIAAGVALNATVGAEHAGLIYPWVRVPVSGAITKNISPEGYAAACRARGILAAGGPWQAPAGSGSVARYVLGPYLDLDRAGGDSLDAGRVSHIRTIAGTTRLYGWRSLSTDETNYALLTGRDTVNVIAQAAADALEDYVFRPIDATGALFSEVEGELVGILEPIASAGGLYPKVDDVNGDLIDPGYSVNVGPDVNNTATIAQNRVQATVAVRVSPVATDLIVTIVKAGLTANV